MVQHCVGEQLARGAFTALEARTGILRRPDATGATALTTASQEGADRAIVDALLAAGAPLDFLTAVNLGRLDEAEAMLRADPARIGRNGADTIALHLACSRKNIPTTRWLLAHGIDTPEPLGIEVTYRVPECVRRISRYETKAKSDEKSALSAYFDELLVVLDDLGAGALIDLAQFGLPHEPTVRESIEAGADQTVLEVALEPLGPQLFDVRVRAERAHPLDVEDADAEHEVFDRPRGVDLERERQCLAGNEDVPLAAVVAVGAHVAVNHHRHLPPGRELAVPVGQELGVGAAGRLGRGAQPERFRVPLWPG